MNLIKIPRKSANDNEVEVVELCFSDGSFVSKGDVIALVEGEKSVYEVDSTGEGYIYYLEEVENLISIDGDLAVLFEAPMIDFNAKDLAQSIKVKVDDEVFDLISKNPSQMPFDYANIDRKRKMRVAAIGAGMGLSQIVDAALSTAVFEVVCAYDDKKFGVSVTSEDGIPIIGDIDVSQILADYNFGIFDFIIISVSTNIRFRKELFSILTPHIPFANIIHKSATISDSSVVGVGNVVLANSVIGPKARIGDNNFISAFCNIEHHCIIEDNCTFGPGTIFSGGVYVSSETKFGTGVHVEPKIKTPNGFVKSGSLLINK